ncbi:TLC domain-containing protein, partial [Haematococcus lacustris]
MGRKDRAQQVFANIYIVVWSVATEILAVYVTVYENGGCTPWSTGPCLTGWPHHSLTKLQRLYMVLMFQFYLHEMVGSLMGIGSPLKTDMLVHHVATMGLIFGAYTVNVTRYGIMWQA